MSARILIIEDNPTNMELMVYLLTAFGYTPLSARDGVMGVETARETLPDLIICDVHLPKLDGYGVVAALKSDPQLAAIPVLAVTALAMVGDRERLLEAGFNGYIGKPIEPDTFITELETYLPGGRSAPAPAVEQSAAEAVECAGQATILIVDDHVLNREFLITLLGYGGHRIVQAADGIEGLRMVAAEKPDLIISDILMPNMDGYEFVSRVRADPVTADLPVIFHTATYREREANQMAVACGVRWVLPKPCDPELILRTVNEALGIVLQSSEAAAPAQAAHSNFSLIDNTVAGYLDEVETSSQVLSRMANDSGSPQPTFDLAHMTDRLASSLSSLQAVSLRLTSLIELGIELGAERDPVALLDIGCRVAQNICVAKYACMGVIEEGDTQLRYFSSWGDKGQARMMIDSPRSGVLETVMREQQPVRIDGSAGDPRSVGLPQGHPPVHSFLCVPIASRERVHGWLWDPLESTCRHASLSIL